MKQYRKFECDKVKEIFEHYPVAIRSKVLSLRELIFNVAESINEVGELTETTKWGEPSYVTAASKSGSTIRIDWKAATPNYYYCYFNCKTTLIEEFREVYGDIFTYGGNRSLVFHKDAVVPLDELSGCIEMALTYHLSKK